MTYHALSRAQSSELSDNDQLSLTWRVEGGLSKRLTCSQRLQRRREAWRTPVPCSSTQVLHVFRAMEQRHEAARPSLLMMGVLHKETAFYLLRTCKLSPKGPDLAATHVLFVPLVFKILLTACQCSKARFPISISGV